MDQNIIFRIFSLSNAGVTLGRVADANHLRNVIDGTWQQKAVCKAHLRCSTESYARFTGELDHHLFPSQETAFVRGFYTNGPVQQGKYQHQQTIIDLVIPSNYYSPGRKSIIFPLEHYV